MPVRDFDTIEETTKIIAIARRSTDDNLQRDSIEAQVEQIERYLVRYNLILDRKFSDNGIYKRDGTGVTIDRTDLETAINYCKSNEIDVILFANPTRLTRQDPTDTENLWINEFKKHQIHLVFCNKRDRLYDLSRHTNRTDLIEELKRSHSFSRSQAENVVANKYSRAERMVLPPYPAFGFEVGRDKDVDEDIWWIVPNEEQLKVIKNAGKMWIAGESGSDITDVVRKSGFKTNKGKEFTWQTIKRILKNEIFHGFYVYAKWKSGRIYTTGSDGYSVEYEGSASVGDKKYKMRLKKQENDVTLKIPVAEQFPQKVYTEIVSQRINGKMSSVEVLVKKKSKDGEYAEYLANTTAPVQIFDEQESAKIFERFDTQSTGVKKRPQLSNHLLTGFCKCAHCGGSLIAGKSRSKDQYVYYFCHNARAAKKENRCPGGNKTIPENLLLGCILSEYYQTAVDEPERVIRECVETAKEMRYSDEYRELKIKIRNISNAIGEMLERGEDDSPVFENLTGRLEELQKREKLLPVVKARDIQRYDGDEWSLTSQISTAIVDGDVSAASRKAQEGVNALVENRIAPTKRFLEDVIDNVSVEWDIRDGRNVVQRLQMVFRLGFTATCERLDANQEQLAEFSEGQIHF